jgi:hypothetical protein
MVVSITWSRTSGGTAVPGPLNHGNISNGSAGTAFDLYIRHNATAAPITSVGFFIQPYSGTGYTGVGTQADYIEIMGWGSTATSTNDSGFYLNQNHAGGFPDGDYTVHKPGQGDSATKISLGTAAINGTGTGTYQDGEIPLGGEAHIKVKIAVPAVEDTAGVRFFDQVLAYTFTS